MATVCMWKSTREISRLEEAPFMQASSFSLCALTEQFYINGWGYCWLTAIVFHPRPLSWHRVEAVTFPPFGYTPPLYQEQPG